MPTYPYVEMGEIKKFKQSQLNTCFGEKKVRNSLFRLIYISSSYVNISNWKRSLQTQ
jgi:hypothetical protein